jgi:tetratricopeptide (TPR) repeat protein
MRPLFTSIIISIIVNLLVGRTLFAQSVDYKTQQKILKGKSLFDAGDLKRSYKIFRTLYSQNRNNAVIAFNLGNVIYKRGYPEIALKFYKKVSNSKSSLSLLAKIYMVRIYDTLDKMPQALELIEYLQKQELPKSLYYLLLDEVDNIAHNEIQYFKEGLRFLDSMEYEKAYQFFQYAWILNSSDKNTLYKGHALLKMGEGQKAQLEFSYIQDDKVYQEAIKLLEENEEKLVEDNKESPYSGYGDISLGNNSNPNTEGDSSTSAIESDTEVNVAFGGAYKYYEGYGLDFKVSLDGYYSTLKSDSTSKSTGIGVSFPISYIYTETYTFGFTSKYERTTYGGEDYVSNLSFIAEHEMFKPNYKAKIELSYTGYDNLASDYSYLSGNGQSIAYTYTHYISDQELSLNFIYGQERLADVDDSIGSYDNLGMTVGYFYPLGLELSLDGSIGYSKSDYKPTSTEFEQSDKAITLEASLTWTPLSWGSFNIKDRYIKNSSNLNDSDDDNNYKQNTLSIGMSAYF